MARLKGERRMRPLNNAFCEAREMARAEGYVLVRHKGCSPFAVLEKDWNSWPLAAPALPVEGEK